MEFIVFITIITVAAAAPEKLAKESTVASDSYNKNSKLICETPACVRAASTILRLMDRNASPCSNFYQFACGKFIEDTVIPDDKSEVNVFTVTEEKLKDQMLLSILDSIKEEDLPIFKSMKSFYQLCMDKEKITTNVENELKEVLESLGGWPILNGLTWNETGFDWKKLVSESSKMGYKTDVFIRLEIDSFLEDERTIQIYYPDMKNTPTNTFDGVNEAAIKAYSKYTTDVAKILGADVELLKKDFTDLLEFELKVKNIYDSKDQISETTVKQMETILPTISCAEYVNEILAPHAHVDENEEIIVWHPTSLNALFTLVDQTPKRVIANYGIWRIIRQSIEGPIVGRLADAAAEYYKSSELREPVQLPRQETCFNLIYEYFSKAAEGIFVRRFFNKKTKSKVVNLVKDIRASLRDMIEQAEWMDSVTKKHALVKLDTMREYIGYPDELMDDEKLNEEYKNLKIHTESFLKFLNSLNRFRMEERFSTLRKIVHETRPDESSIINAGYNHKNNEIVIPVGILHEFFDDTRPNYLNYGAIGWFIGHEMTHAFDSTGSQYDKNGQLANWWKIKTKQKYIERVKCLVKQYSDYTIPDINMTVNGYMTRGENIADNGGVKAAYFAYNGWTQENGLEPLLPELDYTPQQMFWISAASIWCQKIRPQRLKLLNMIDEHTPAEFRIIGTMSNIPEFSKDFNCPLESAMNPNKKCTVF